MPLTINEYQPKPLPALYVDLTGSLKNWGKITDYMRLAVGQRYLSLLEKRTVNSPRPSAQVRDQFYKELGVTLTSVDEWNEMIEAFEEGRQKFQDRFWGDFTPQFAMGLFQVVAVTNQVANPLFQGTEQFAVVLYGVDLFGEPKDGANYRRDRAAHPACVKRSEFFTTSGSVQLEGSDSTTFARREPERRTRVQDWR